MSFLSVLHNTINAIAPITGLSEDAAGNIFDVDYVNPPTPEQLAQIQAVLAGWSGQKIKLAQLEQLDKEWAETLKAGWETPYGWKLGLEIADVTLLTGAYTLAKEAAPLNLPLPEIIDTTGAPHTFNDIQEFTALMLQYGQARAALSAQYAANKAAIG